MTALPVGDIASTLAASVAYALTGARPSSPGSRTPHAWRARSSSRATSSVSSSGTSGLSVSPARRQRCTSIASCAMPVPISGSVDRSRPSARSVDGERTHRRRRVIGAATSIRPLSPATVAVESVTAFWAQDTVAIAPEA